MNLPSASSRYAWGRLHAAVFLQGSSILAMEIVLSRVLGVVMWHHFASLAISLALLGLTAGTVAVYLRPGLASDDPSAQGVFPATGIGIGIGSALIFLFFCAAGRLPAFGHWFFAVFSHPFYEPYGAGATGSDSGGALILHLLVLCLLLTLPFAAGGLFLAGVLTRFPASAGGLYAANLLGAGFGCYLSVGVLGAVDGFSAVLLAALPAMLSSFLLAPGLRLRAAVALMAAAIGVMAVLNVRFHLSRYPFVRGRYQPDILHEAWDATSRVAVYPLTGNQEEGSWGQSRRFQAALPPQLELVVDDSGFSTITSWPADGNLEFMRYNILALPYLLKPGADALIIGPGGGRDILAAMAMQARKIVAVEINPLVIDAVDRVFGDFSGRPYSRERVTTHVAEARSFLVRHGERYDLLQAALVYGRLPSSAGAFTLTEEQLYTRESFGEYLDRLRDDGVLAISRFVFERRILRLVALGREALRARGVRDPWRHFFIASERGLATLILKKNPLSEGEVGLLKSWCDRLGYQVLYAPGNRTTNAFSQLLEAEDAGDFYRRYRFDVSPVTDDRPYFYYLLKPSDFWRVMAGGGQFEFEDRAVILVRNVLAILVLLTALMVILPLARTAARPSVSTTTAAVGYFGGIALGFITVEIVLLKSLILFLGYPVLSLSVVLAGILLSAGSGSLAANRLAGQSRPAAVGMWIVMTAGLIALFPLWARPVLDAVLPAALPVRIGAAALVIVPLGFTMGACFPAGLCVLRRADPTLLPWAVGINGACSVLGAMAAMLLAVNYGFRLTLGVGALGYVLALACLGPLVGKHRGK